MKPVDSEPLITVKEVARRFGVPPSWVYSHAEDGSLPSLKIGRYRRFEPEAIEEYLRGQRQGCEAGNGDAGR